MRSSINFLDTQSQDTLTVEGVRKAKHRRLMSAKTINSFNPFHSLGGGYRPPKADHKYKIKYAPRMGKFDERPKSVNYMTKIVQKAKKMIDP